MNEADILIAKLTDIESRHGSATVRKEILSMLTLRDFGLGTDFLDYVRERFTEFGDTPVGFNLLLCAVDGYVESFVWDVLKMDYLGDDDVSVRGVSICKSQCREDMWVWEVPNRDIPSAKITVCQPDAHKDRIRAASMLVAHEYKEQLELDGVRAWDPHASLRVYDFVPGYELKDFSVFSVDRGEAMKKRLPEGLLAPGDIIYAIGWPGYIKWKTKGVDNVRFTTRWEIPKDVLEKLEAA